MSSEISRVIYGSDRASILRRSSVVAGGIAALMFSAGAQAQVFEFNDLPTLGLFTQDAADALAGTTAAKITGLLSDEDAAGWFNALSLDHVFLDIEKERVVINTRKTVQQTVGTLSDGAFVGNFRVDPLNPDSTHPDPGDGITQAGYFLSRATMANDVLYPGAPSFRTPAAGSSSDPAGSDAPNIRSSLFTLPILRATSVENMRGVDVDPGPGELILFPESHEHLPYVARFNNFGNSHLNTGLEVGPNPVAENVRADKNGVQYVFDARPGATNEGQLLSRGDFEAQIAHLRLRGADGVVLFEPGVVGYTKEQAVADAVSGWSKFDVELANATELVGSEDAMADEAAGALWSGVVQNDGLDELLTVLFSNLGDDELVFELPETIGGFDVVDGFREYAVAAGEHLLVDFGEFLGEWHVLNNPDTVFADDNRDGIGIPEPASVVMLVVGTMLVGLPRSRRQ